MIGAPAHALDILVRGDGQSNSGAAAAEEINVPIEEFKTGRGRDYARRLRLAF